ncbi:hypothetical protein BuS5_00639 [Desulfosarcina sp. BuS5]|nr:hypothetical protein BuS5_00639 [Desulfosarcina sp. BuS5]
MKVVGSIKKMDQITDLLLTDELLMSMCGFNAYQVKNGSCKRGEKLRKTYVPAFRGALCVDTVAKHIVRISPRKIENFFNRCIQQLAKQGLFPKIGSPYKTMQVRKISYLQGIGTVMRYLQFSGEFVSPICIAGVLWLYFFINFSFSLLIRIRKLL